MLVGIIFSIHSMKEDQKYGKKHTYNDHEKQNIDMLYMRVGKCA